MILSKLSVMLKFMDAHMRLATKNDLNAIVSIYNQFISTSVTMDTEEVPVASKKNWFNAHNKYYPIICYVTDNEVIGWASLSKWSEKIGYAKTVEESIYVIKKYHGQGFG